MKEQLKLTGEAVNNPREAEEVLPAYYQHLAEYGVIGLVEIWLIDLGTLAIALITLLCVTIPNPFH